MRQVSDRIGRQIPNKHVFNEGYTSIFDNPKVVNRLKRWGFYLLPWQNFVVRDCLSLNDKGNIAYKNVGLSTMRQQGKSEIIIALIVFFLIYSNPKVPENILYSSYHGSSMDAIFDRMLEKIKKNKELKKYFPVLPSEFSKNKIIEAVDPLSKKKLGRVLFQTRRGGAGRGGTYSKIFFDEAQKLTEAEHDSYSGSTITMINGQIFYFGTPSTFDDAGSYGRGANSGTGEFFLNIRREILNKNVKNSCWCEWGVSEIPRDRFDKDVWYDCIPSLGFSLGAGKGVTEAALESFAGSNESFATEYLGYWPSQAKERAIDISLWRQLETDNISENVDSSCKFSIAIKNNSSEDTLWVSISTRDVFDNIVIDLFKKYDLNAPWVDNFWNDLKNYFKNNRVVAIFIDGNYAKSAIQNILVEKKIWSVNKNQNRQGRIYMVSARDLSLASAGIISLIKEGRVIHSGQYQLDAAVEDAKKRFLRGDSGGFAFSSMSGKIDVTPLEVVSLSTNGVVKNSNPVNNSDVNFENSQNLKNLKSGKILKGYNVNSGLSGWS